MITVPSGRMIIGALPDDTTNIIDLLLVTDHGDQAHRQWVRQAAQTCMKACIESIGMACQTRAKWLDYRPEVGPTLGRFCF